MHWGAYEDCCLAEVDGHAAIAYNYYIDWDDNDYYYLKYARRIE